MKIDLFFLACDLNDRFHTEMNFTWEFSEIEDRD